MVYSNKQTPGGAPGSTTQNAAVTKLTSDGWQVLAKFDLRPWNGPVILQKEARYIAVGPDGQQEAVPESELPQDWDVSKLRREQLFERLMTPFWIMRQWCGAFGCGIIWKNSPDDSGWTSFGFKLEGTIESGV